jgi:hypothetical protein
MAGSVGRRKNSEEHEPRWVSAQVANGKRKLVFPISGFNFK